MGDATTISGPTSQETVPSREASKGFLDDPYNMAMYVVLPCLILVYGGCGFIYCAHRLHRHCKRQSRKRQRLLKPEDSDKTGEESSVKVGISSIASRDLDNLSVVDLCQSDTTVVRPAPKPKPKPKPKPQAPIVRPRPKATVTKTNARTTSRTSLTKKPETAHVGTMTDDLPKDSPGNLASRVQVHRPGYKTGGGEFQQQMQHLDDQLKAAFKRIQEDAGAKSWPDNHETEGENARPVKKRTESRLRFFVSPP